MRIPFCKADIGPLEKSLVEEVMKSGYLSNGPMLEKFEELFSKYIEVPHAIAVNSGTSALHLAVKALGLGRGDEVITTPFSFVASSNCLMMEGVRPVFSDIDPFTYNLDPSQIEEKITDRTRAILPVDIFGYPVDMDKIRLISKRYGLSIIEDSCQALGSEYKCRRVGGNADIAAFAFFPNKQITTGEGGMVVTSYDQLGNLCRVMRSHGRTGGGTEETYDLAGHNYKMPELSAALGVGQMIRIDEIMQKRRKVKGLYANRLEGMEGVKFQRVESFVSNNAYAFTVEIEEDIRELVIMNLRESGIASKPHFPPIHLQEFYARPLGYKEGDFPVTERISKRVLALPFYGDLSESEIDYVASKLEKTIKDSTQRKSI